MTWLVAAGQISKVSGMAGNRQAPPQPLELVLEAFPTNHRQN